MNEREMIQYLEVCSNMIHKAATRKAHAVDDGDGYAVVPVTVCLLVAIDKEGNGNVVGSTVRVPLGAPGDKMADVLRRSAAAVEAIGDQTEEGSHHFAVDDEGALSPIATGEKFDA